MIQLSPGEVIHVRDDLRNASECAAGLVPSMRNMAGEWVTIQDYWGSHEGQHCYYIQEDNGYAVWSEDCFDMDSIVDEDESTPDITELI